MKSLMTLPTLHNSTMNYLEKSESVSNKYYLFFGLTKNFLYSIPKI